MGKSSFLSGTLTLTIATMLSKLLGFVYIIPFVALVGVHGNILFEYAYKPYIIMLSVSTLGIPMAVSKFVAKYNELGQYNTVNLLYRSGMGLMWVGGFLSFLVLYFGAPFISISLIGGNDSTGTGVSDIIMVIRAVSFALLIIPATAFMRGFMQGHHDMRPTAVSQVIEQLIRIVVILGGVYLTIRVLNRTIAEAVALSTFAAFIGGLVSFLVLLWFQKSKSWNTPKDSNLPTLTVKGIYFEIIKYAIPFVLVGLVIPFYQTIDTFTINRALMATGQTLKDAEVVNSIVSLIQKLIFIPVSLATAFSITLVPLITKAYISSDYDAMNHDIAKMYKVLWFFSIPMIFGMMALASPIYVTLFGTEFSSTGGRILFWHSSTAFVFCMFSVTAAVLQGMDLRKALMLNMGIGLAIKLFVNYPLVYFMSGAGPGIATFVALSLTIVMNIRVIRNKSGFSFSPLVKDMFLIGMLSLTMLVFVKCSDLFISVYSDGDYLGNLYRAGVGCLLGAGVYALGVLLIPSYRMLFLQRIFYRRHANKTRGGI